MFGYNRIKNMSAVFIRRIFFHLSNIKTYSLLKLIISDREIKFHIHNIHHFCCSFMISQFAY